MVNLPFKKRAVPVTPDSEMTLLEHLIELRKRIIRSVLAIVAGAIVVYIFARPIFNVLRAPYCDFQSDIGGECVFLTTRPMESFSFLLTMVGYGGLLLAMPVVLYQFGRFVMPGLYPHERRVLLPFAVGSVVLLAIGVVAAYFVTPQALRVLNEFGFDGFTPFYSPTEYVGFLIKMLIAFGIAAELPLVLIFLQMVGVVSPQMLAGNRRIALALIVLLGAIITPTGDPFNLAIVAVPMYLFFEISIIIGRIITVRRARSGATV